MWHVLLYILLAIFAISLALFISIIWIMRQIAKDVDSVFQDVQKNL